MTSNAPPELTALVGQELAGFHLSALLGEGGMACVFRGENSVDASILRAIKVVRPELGAKKEFRVRVAEEARILERLQHPNVVRFFGVRQDRGFLVLELELLSGESLGARLLAKKRATPNEAARWIRDAAEGVAAAHALGIVHRDLKPDNLFLTDAGGIKVLDFGIARALDEAERATSATAAGTAPGTAAYLAPEVWAGAKPDPRSDVYALGLTLAELLLGRHPFVKGDERKSAPQYMFDHVNGSLDFSAIPATLRDVLRRATAREPPARFSSARELATALRDAAAVPETSVRTSFELAQFDSSGSVPIKGAPASTGVNATTGASKSYAVPSPAGTEGALVASQRAPGRRTSAIAVAAVITAASVAFLWWHSRAPPSAANREATPDPSLSAVDAAPSSGPAPATSAAATPSADAEADSYAPNLGEPVIVRAGPLAFAKGRVQAVKGTKALVDTSEQELDTSALSPVTTPPNHDWHDGEVVLVPYGNPPALAAATVHHVRIDNQLTLSVWTGKDEATVVFSPPTSLKAGQGKLDQVIVVRPSWGPSITAAIAQAKADLGSVEEQAKARAEQRKKDAEKAGEAIRRTCIPKCSYACDPSHPEAKICPSCVENCVRSGG